jgi:hypothetical protein
LAGGVLVGGFGIISKIIERNSQGMSLSRKKLEQLHGLLFRFGIDLFSTHNEVIVAPSHKVDVATMDERLRGWMIEPVVKIFTIQELYAHELESEFAKLLNAYAGYKDAVLKYIETGYSNPKAVGDAFEQAKKEISNASDAVKDYMFAKGFIPNQRYVNRFKAAWRHTNRVLGDKD